MEKHETMVFRVWSGTAVNVTRACALFVGCPTATNGNSCVRSHEWKSLFVGTRQQRPCVPPHPTRNTTNLTIWTFARLEGERILFLFDSYNQPPLHPPLSSKTIFARMAIETGGTSWHQSNRGVSLYIALYLSLFLLVVVVSVRPPA